MTAPKGILTSLETLLEGSSDLTGVADDAIFIGDRDVETLETPNLIIVPIDNQEEISDVNYDEVRNVLTVALVGTIKDEDRETREETLLDLENNVKKAIYSDPYLSQTVNYIFVGRTVYVVGEGLPWASFEMELRIEYDQNKTTRV